MMSLDILLLLLLVVCLLAVDFTALTWGADSRKLDPGTAH